MLTKLPVIINNKSNNICFRITLEDNYIILNPYNYDNNFIKVICSSNYGMYGKNIMFPLRFEIIGKYLFCELFFYLFKTKRNTDDFFSLFLQYINKKLKNKYKFADLNFLKNQININNNIINNNYNKYNYKNEFKTVNDFIYFTYFRKSFLFNYFMFLNYSRVNELLLLISKKQTTIINYINNQKIFYNGRESTIEDIIYMINNNDNINIGNKMKKVFLTNDNITLIYNINNENIKKVKDKFNITYFPKIECSIDNLFEQIMIFHEFKLLKKLINKFYKNNNYYSEFIGYYYNENNYDYLTYLKLLNIKIENVEDKYKYYLGNKIMITQDELSFDFFKNIVTQDNNFNEDVIRTLLNNFTLYPIINNKKNIDIQYKKILFYSNKFINNINKLNMSNITSKTKNLYLLFIDFLNNIKRNNVKYFTNIKIYKNYLFFNILKILLFNDNFLNIEHKYKKEFIKNFLYYKMCNVLKLDNIKFYYDNIKFIYDKNILLDNHYKEYLNFKVRKYLNNPIVFFSNIVILSDFQNWINIISNNIDVLFYQNIVIKPTDTDIISRILYYCSIVNNQNDKDYLKFVKICARNHYLVIYENHINIKFNEILKKNLNYGILLRDINNYIETNHIKSDIDKYKSKYYKYKTKYFIQN
jgi:hypothetical protein